MLSQFRQTRLIHYTLAVLTAASIVILSLPLAAPVRALRAALHYAVDPMAYSGFAGVSELTGVSRRLINLVDASKDNGILRRRLAEMDLMSIRLQGLEKENTRLREELKLKLPAAERGLWAHVLEKEPFRWYQDVVIDAGETRGVKRNAPVFAPSSQGLAVVGQVIEVRPETSDVLLVTNPMSSVAAYISSETASGLVLGQGGAILKMLYLPPGSTPAVGQPVYTSAVSPTFPAHMLIGTVARVGAPDMLYGFLSAEVVPAAAPQGFSEVLVLLPHAGRPGKS